MFINSYQQGVTNQSMPQPQVDNVEGIPLQNTPAVQIPQSQVLFENLSPQFLLNIIEGLNNQIEKDKKEKQDLENKFKAVWDNKEAFRVVLRMLRKDNDECRATNLSLHKENIALRATNLSLHKENEALRETAGSVSNENKAPEEPSKFRKGRAQKRKLDEDKLETDKIQKQYETTYNEKLEIERQLASQKFEHKILRATLQQMESMGQSSNDSLIKENVEHKEEIEKLQKEIKELQAALISATSWTMKNPSSQALKRRRITPQNPVTKKKIQEQYNTTLIEKLEVERELASQKLENKTLRAILQNMKSTGQSSNYELIKENAELIEEIEKLQKEIGKLQTALTSATAWKNPSSQEPKRRRVTTQNPVIIED